MDGWFGVVWVVNGSWGSKGQAWTALTGNLAINGRAIGAVARGCRWVGGKVSVCKMRDFYIFIYWGKIQRERKFELHIFSLM